MPRALSLMPAGLLFCNLAMSPALAQVAGEDLDGPPSATATQSQAAGQPQLFTQQPTQAQEHAQAQRFIERFQAANTMGDGRLTLAQAQAGHLPMVVRNFDAIDAQHKGYVTLQDVRAYRRQMRAMREGGDSTSD
jgi:hypothetical protein